MARKVEVTLIDDLDGSEDAKTTYFAFQGKSYEIDLNEQNLQRLTDVLQEFIAAARPVRSRGAARGRRSGDASAPKPAKVRAWAAANNIEVSQRGRIPVEVLDAYNAAH